eukprot:TRINITY_DN4743_c1_g1_i1.p1 TRINITY_DN4743_c1_g1~~TRINITY_DN4743_c1_g1_i1.p1  ORF type:complete len:403 (+),score=59.28 TRINITY_DN4743_c1_g1_i1:221-1429(+)
MQVDLPFVECKTGNTIEAFESISNSEDNEIQSVEMVEAENQGVVIQSVYGVTDSDAVECVEPFAIVQSDRDFVIGEQKSSEYEFIPFAPDDLKPYVGMKFTTQEYAIEFYNAYANACGFSIRKNWIRKSQKTGEIIYRVVSCSKEGKRHDKYSKNNDRKRAPKAITRIGCLAMIGIARKSLDCWEIKKFEEKHCHDCVALTRPNVLLHRKASDEHLTSIRSMEEDGLGTTKASDFPMYKTGETENLDYADRSARNSLINKTATEMSVTERRDDLSRLSNSLSIIGSKSEQAYEFVKNGIERLLEQVDKMNKESRVSMGQNDIQAEQFAAVVGMGQNGSLDEQYAVEVGISGDSLMALSSSNIETQDLTSVHAEGHGTDKRIKSTKGTQEHQSETCPLIEERQ